MARHLSRRALINQFAVPALAAAFVAACGGQAAPAAPAAKPGEAPKPAADAKPAEAAKPAADAKPAAGATPVYSGVTGTVVTAAKPAADASKAKGTMRYLYNATPGANEKVHLDLIDLFGKLYPDVTVEKIRVPDDAEGTRKLLAMIAANDVPDLFWNRQRTATPFIARGALMDLKPMVTADKIDLNDFWPSALKTFGRGDGLYGLPSSSSSNAYYFNADLYQAAGVPLPTETAKKGPWNWDVLTEQAVKITKGDGPNKVFGFDPVLSIYSVDMYIWQNGGKLWDDDLKECYLNSPEAVGALQFLVDFTQKHKAMPTSAETGTSGSGGATDLFAGGRTAIKMAGRFILDTLLKSTFTVGMVIAPDGPKANTTRGDDLASSIVKNAKNPEAAWAYAKMWTADDGQKIILDSRRSFTARRSFLNSDAMKQFLLPWEDLETYKLGLERTGVYVAPNHTGEVNTIFDRELNLAYLGEKSVKDATETMKKEIDVALKKPL
ncbi:MAG: sugar ABC transporter substrate-binding protein [Chloroflexi bacterium]|nr:sugar ABC transporter substrate-binding protein [Chloroflexota bacterium]